MTVFARITAQRSGCKLCVCVCVCVFCRLEGIVEQVCGDQRRKDLVFHAKSVPGPHDHRMGDADPWKTSSEKQGDWICPLCKLADLHPALVFCLFAPCHSCSITQCFHTLPPKNNALHKTLGRNMDFVQCRDFCISKTAEGLRCKTAEGVTVKGAHNLTMSPSPSPSLAASRVPISLRTTFLQSLLFPLTPGLYWRITLPSSSVSLSLPLSHAPPSPHSAKKDLPTSISSYTLKGTREY